MNLNQSAHGDREFGFICARLRLTARWSSATGRTRTCTSGFGVWTRAACAWHDAQRLKIARFGDNMREVAVTEGDKVEAQMQLGYSVNGYGVGDLVARIERGRGTPKSTDLVQEYDEELCRCRAARKNGQRRAALRDAARIELGMRAFLEERRIRAFTDTFEDLHGLKQLPGLARLSA